MGKSECVSQGADGSKTLSECPEFEGHVLRDAAFCTLGLSNSRPGSPFLSFLDGAKYVDEALANDQLSCLICTEEVAHLVRGSARKMGVAIMDEPRLAFFKLHNRLAKAVIRQRGKSPTFIDSSATVSKHAFVDEYNVIIGSGAVIEPFAVVSGPCRIGAGAIIRSGARVGSSGFEYKRDDGAVLPVVHAGSVVIGSDVELKANSSVDSAVYDWDETRVGEHSKLNSGSHIDHGSHIGRCVFVGANAVVSGRVTVGDGCTIGPGAVVSNRITIGDNSTVSLGSVVTKDVPANSRVSGNFAVPHRSFLAHVKAVAAGGGDL